MKLLNRVLCYIAGHEDVIRRQDKRLWLECLNCGRETQGMRIDAADAIVARFERAATAHLN